MQTKRSIYMNEWIIKYLSPLRSDLLPCDETCNAFKLRSLRWVNRKRKFWCLKRGLIHGKRHQARVKRGQRCKKRSLLHRVGGKIDNLWKLSYLIYLNINVGLYKHFTRYPLNLFLECMPYYWYSYSRNLNLFEACENDNLSGFLNFVLVLAVKYYIYHINSTLVPRFVSKCIWEK